MIFIPLLGGKETTILWLALPFILGFVSYLLPQLDRYLALGVGFLSLGYGCVRLLDPAPLSLELLDHFSVTVLVDTLSGFLILTNALVTLAVVLYSWSSGKSAFFFAQLIILHSSVNAVFICADFMSLYVALEVIGIAAFLLITYPRSERAIWVGLRYLFISNTAMLFYLIGAVLVYQANHSFAFSGLQNAPVEAVVLICIGLLTKGGLFISGLWLPLTHAEAETAVSALLSGVVVKAGVFPLVRCAQLVPDLQPLLAIISLGSAVLGVSYALFEQDSKRLLAWSTISQVGFILAAPAEAGFYALTHGLAKAALFLTAGNLPSRDLQTLRQTRVPGGLWIVLILGGLSISGFPLLAGFGAKILTLKQLAPWQMTVMNVAAVGTAIVFAKLIFLPPQLKPDPQQQPSVKLGFWLAVILLVLGLVAANGFDLESYQLANLGKSVLTIGIGWFLYWIVIRRINVELPRVMEQFQHLIGIMSVMLSMLFWMVMA
ncbi:MAG: cation:proton antiporter [Synechococcaceae cyanobacterium SM2_3_1]|nr:cation:proton antiporter [Synechococcaceae cyanobacterium SM2_3_1]